MKKNERNNKEVLKNKESEIKNLQNENAAYH
jgi:hypothetical protein